MDSAEVINVEVVYALRKRQRRIELKIAAGSSVEDAIRQSGILEEFPQIDVSSVKVGIYSRLVCMKTPLQAGDRLEIYRPLTVNPRTGRQLRIRRQSG
jgi:putative ubiquitin-RnfH superfamily antitoxin RatB of RatAB toxin-antitoxin module